jgi:putative membrane protein
MGNLLAAAETIIAPSRGRATCGINQDERTQRMFDHLLPFLLHWAITSLSLWAASHVFKGIRFADTRALIVAALLLGFANAIVRPLLIVLTFPLTLLTFGFFLLVINALMLLLVAALVRGFTISGFWTAFFASVFIALLSFAIGVFVDSDSPAWQPPGKGLWVDYASDRQRLT